MKRPSARWWLVLLLLGGALLLSTVGGSSQAEEPLPALLTGEVFDGQGVPVKGAEVTLVARGAEETPLSEALTQPNGRYTLVLPEAFPDALTVHVHRPHFADADTYLSRETVETLRAGTSIVLPDIILPRVISAAFWVATLIFAGVLILIATGRLHNTLSALLGAATLLAVSYLGSHLISESLFIFTFPEALSYVDWNVIFLIMGMMIVIAVVERTGFFQWLAFMAYRLSGGRLWLLLPILMVATGIASAFLDNVTTMLLMTPITVQIALAMSLNPLALLIPEVMASNVVGISTLVGTPTNILIGSYAHIYFNDFLINLTPGVLLALLGLIIYCELIYRKEFQASDGGRLSQVLLKALEERARITEPDNLKKACIVGIGMVVLFVVGDQIHLLPAVTALMGAAALLLWIRPDVEEMIESVDWTTLVFFFTLFICVGALQEVGLISLVADSIGTLVGDNLLLAMLVVTWSSALLSTVIANIPFTAAMLPVIGYLTITIPGAESQALFYSLSVGSAMGGNGSLIGASANMVTAGIAERAGHPITYAYFFRKGFPAMLITVGLATIWLLVRFLMI